jgi:8-oxo-dGTP pyrophosphatase MutT (NUDIX family)
MSSIESRIQALISSDDLPQKLATGLRHENRGAAPRTSMAPELSYGRYAGPAPYTARPAAVVLLLYLKAGRWFLPLTERSASLARHPGQISLPGGAVDAHETSSQAAIRELNEELGVKQPVEILGRLADCYVFPSDFLVTPWVAVTNVEPHWQPHEREVQGVVEMPIDVLLDENAIGSLQIERGLRFFHAPCIRVGNTCIWGVTCIILSELADVLRHLLETY